MKVKTQPTRETIWNLVRQVRAVWDSNLGSGHKVLPRAEDIGLGMKFSQ